MTINGKPVRVDWTLNIGSLVNAAMLIALIVTAIGSYYELKSGVKVALEYIAESKHTVSELRKADYEAEKDRNAIARQLNAIGVKIDFLRDKIKDLEEKLP